MMDAKATSKKLSKAVLDLKFMKKSKEKALVQEENEERQQLYQDQLSSLHEGAEKIVMVNSYVDCLKFLPCRLSFGGMDPDIEKLNEEKLTGLYTVVKTAPKEVVTEMNADISAKDMASHYHPTARRPMPGHHTHEEEEEEEDNNMMQRKVNPNHNKTFNPSQDKKKFKGKNMRDIYKVNIEQEGEGLKPAKFGRKGRGGRGGKNGGFRGSYKGGYNGGRDRDMNFKEEGFNRGRQGPFRGAGSRGHSKGDKRNYEGSQGHHRDSDGPGWKKVKTERD